MTVDHVAGRYADPEFARSNRFAKAAFARSKQETVGLKLPALIENIAGYDPSPRKKYVDWLVRKYGDGGIKRFEDLSRAEALLRSYDALKNKSQNPDKSKNLLTDAEKDINRIKTLSDLGKLIKAHAAADLTSKKDANKADELAFYKFKEAILLHDDKDIKIVIPLTEKASCYFGRNTEWCTAATNSTNYFSHYTSSGERLYIVLIKKENKRFQFSFDSNQYMDENDDEIDPHDLARVYPVLWKIFREPSLKENSIVFVRHATEEQKLNAVDHDVDVIKYIEKPSRRVQMTAIGKNPECLGHIKKPLVCAQLAAVRKNGYFIADIEQPPKSVQIAAVREDTSAIAHIQNPVEAAQLIAVKKTGQLIQYIKDPSEAVQIAAVTQNYNAFSFIRGNITEAVRLTAVKNDGQALGFMTNPSEAVQLAAVEQDGLAIGLIKKPSAKIKMAAVQQNGLAIQYITRHTLKIQRIAVSDDGNAITFIDNPSIEIQILAVQNKGSAIRFIEKPSKEVQLAAFEQDKGSAFWVKNRCESLRMLVQKEEEKRGLRGRIYHTPRFSKIHLE